MKIAGAVLLGLSLMVTLVLSISPTHVSFLGTTGSCGAPVINTFQPTEDPADDFGVTRQCRQQSLLRLVEGGAVLLTVGLAGLLMLTLSPSQASRKRDEWARWQQWQHHQAQAQQWAAYQREREEWERRNRLPHP